MEYYVVKFTETDEVDIFLLKIMYDENQKLYCTMTMQDPTTGHYSSYTGHFSWQLGWDQRIKFELTQEQYDAILHKINQIVRDEIPNVPINELIDEVCKE